MKTTSLALLAAVALCTLTAVARAQEGEAATTVAPEGEGGAAPAGTGEAAGESAEGPEHAPSHLILGAGLQVLTTTLFADALDVNGSIGGGIFAEYTVVPEWLAIELDVRLLAAHEGVDFGGELPIDLLLKKPFELSHTLEAYIGIGGTVVPILRSPADPGVLGGLATVVGGYWWFAEHLALNAEVDWNLLFGAPNVIQEVGISAGIALGI